MNNGNNPFGAYFEGAFRAAIASCFIGGRISERQIDIVKELMTKFRGGGNRSSDTPGF